MSGTPMHRSSVKQVTIVYRALAIAGAAAAFGMLAFGAPGLSDEPEVAAAPTRPADQIDTQAGMNQSEQGDSTMSQLEVTEIAMRFGWAEDEQKTPDQQPEQTAGSGDSQKIQFLGSILSSSRRLAMLSLDGTQRVLSEGQEIDDPALGRIKLVTVLPQIIQIEHNGVRQRISKRSRSGSVLSVVRQVQTTQPAGGFDPENIKARREKLLRDRASARLEEERPDWRKRQVIDEKEGIRTKSGDGGETKTVPLDNGKRGAIN